MKNLLLVLPLLCVAPSCKTLDSLLEVPAAVVEDVGGAVDTTVGVVDPSPEAKVAGQVADTGVSILTGNAALGAAAGSIVTILASIFLRKRKKPA